MANFGKVEFKKHLSALGIRRGVNIVCHSALYSFGRCEPRIILDALLEIIGDSGNLVFPSYTFGNKEFYDPTEAVPAEMGSLSGIAHLMEQSYRSLCPVHNHIAVGPIAHTICENNPNVSFGSGSDFEWFEKHNFDLLLLGCSFRQGATYLHHLEALAQVPYRKLVKSPKKIKINGKVQTLDFNYFERRGAKKLENFDIVKDLLSENLKCVAAPYGNSYKVSIKSIKEIILPMLSVKPELLVVDA